MENVNRQQTKGWEQAMTQVRLRGSQYTIDVHATQLPSATPIETPLIYWKRARVATPKRLAQPVPVTACVKQKILSRRIICAQARQNSDW